MSSLYFLFHSITPSLLVAKELCSFSKVNLLATKKKESIKMFLFAPIGRNISMALIGITFAKCFYVK